MAAGPGGNTSELHCSRFWYFLPPTPTEAMINKTVGKEASCGCLRARLEPLEKKRGRRRGEDGERKEEAALLPPALAPAAPCEERRAGGEPAGGAS